MWSATILTAVILTLPFIVAGNDSSTDSKESGDEEPDTLRFLQVIFRHGARSPTFMFEGDPDNDFWTEGIGELTNAGIDKEYKLGVWLGNRYRKYLGTTVNNGSVYFRSTDKDRTLASAQLVAAGVFPPTDEDKWNDHLGQLWQPVPVHTVPRNMDPFVDNYPRDFCPRYNQLMSLLQKTPEGKRVLKDNSDINELIFNETGQKMDNFAKFLDPCDTYILEDSNHLELPFSESIKDRLMPLCDYYVWYLIKTPEMIKLAGGYLIKEIGERFALATEGKLGNLKAYFYSAHDYTNMFIQAAMGVFNYINPPFSSALILELHEHPEGQFFIKILYRNDSAHEPYILQIPNCTSECPLEEAARLTQQNFIDDLQAACKPFTPTELMEKQNEYDIAFP